MSNYIESLPSIAPELALTVLLCAVLVVDLLLKGRDSRKVGYLTLGGLAVIGWLLVGQWSDLGATGAQKRVFGMIEIDRFGTFFKLFTVGSLAIVALFVLLDRRERRHGIGEYFLLLLGAGLGIFFMVSTSNLLLLMLGLELLSLASYALAGFHKGDKRSAEAAMKYVVFGGLSAGIMLYGISLLYGMTGTIDLAAMASGPNSLAAQFQISPVPVAVAIVLVLAGFAYKVSVVPFHFWTPDVYEGAPTPVTTFLAVGSKAAGFGALLRFTGKLFLVDGADASIQQYGARIGMLLAILAAVTMTLGNLAALRQSSLKRMLAYSSIAHAGYVLVGLATMESSGWSAAMFYLAAYYFMNLGAFGFVLYFESVTGSDDIASLRGLGAKALWVTVPMVVFLISLTGIPPTVGFTGKYLLFIAGVEHGYAWLAVVMALNSVVSLFYYLRIAKALFFAEPVERAMPKQTTLAGSIAALAVFTVIFGLYITPLQEWVKAGVSSLRLSIG
ncbi:MAG: NADH-quinone oxidoreductase subunit N [Planctomycetota bacterium]|nr:MAG: NADH-quinone oxidoreductase subunit N [Planctomycetota bacterium]